MIPIVEDNAMSEAVQQFADSQRQHEKTKEMENECFPPDTLVWCESGMYPIQDIAVGMKVLSRCEKTGELAYKRISKFYEHEGASIGYAEFKTTKLVGNRVVKATLNHPFWVDSKGWVAFADLKLGDCLVAQDGELMPITYLKHAYDDDYLVYNLEIEDFHTYFVEWEGIWVHNDCSVSGRKYERA